MPVKEKDWRDFYSAATVEEIWRELRRRYDQSDEDIAQEVIARVLTECPLDPVRYARKIAPTVASELKRPHVLKGEDGAYRRTASEHPGGLAHEYAQHIAAPKRDYVELRQELQGREQHVLSLMNGTPRMAECHPERENHGYGKCWPCFAEGRRRAQ